jgi:hypothetical protein
MAPDSRNTHTADGSHTCANCAHSKDGPTPTQRSYDNDNNFNDGDSYIQQSIEQPNPPMATRANDSNFGPHRIYIVTDTCYPTAESFQNNIGTTHITSVHSTKAAANSRAKKIIYENDGDCTVDLDKIIEEVKQGLYIGIGVGGKEEKGAWCFARKCEVEGKIVDEDSDSEETSGESGDSDLVDGMGEADGDVDMG